MEYLFEHVLRVGRLPGARDHRDHVSHDRLGVGAPDTGRDAVNRRGGLAEGLHLDSDAPQRLGVFRDEREVRPTELHELGREEPLDLHLPLAHLAAELLEGEAARGTRADR